MRRANHSSILSNCEPMCDKMITSYCLMKSGFYQWLWSFLLAHLLLITFPAYLWEILEGKRLNKLLQERVKIDNMAKFLTDHPDWYTSYEATSFFLCQVLAMSSFVIKVLFMNFYIGINALLSIFVPLDEFAFQQTCNMSQTLPSGSDQLLTSELSVSVPQSNISSSIATVSQS